MIPPDGRGMIVIIESPFKCATKEEAARNLEYAKAALRDSLLRGEAPFASHLLYTLVLDDSKPEERKLGMEAGFKFVHRADFTAVYDDLGISRGMHLGIDRAQDACLRIEFRQIPGWVLK